MKKILIILLITVAATAIGLYFRPSYAVIGQLDWWNVLTKGFFVGTFSALFSQGFIDESFWFVMRFTMGGLILALIFAMTSGGSKSPKAKKK